MDKLPQISTLYRALDRFKSKKEASCLLQVNKALLGSLVNEFVILDLDSTVNTVHGSRKGSFWPNAADLWLKAIAYNVLLILKSMAPEEYQK